MSSVKATQLRPGMVIQHEGQLFTIFSVDHRTPGNKRGSMQTRMRNLRTGEIIDYRFRAEEFVDRAILDEVEFEYLYNEGDDRLLEVYAGLPEAMRRAHQLVSARRVHADEREA